MVGSLKMAVSVAQVQRPWAFLSAGSEAKNTTSEAWKYNVLCSCGYATAVLPSCVWGTLAFSSQGPPEARGCQQGPTLELRYCQMQAESLPLLLRAPKGANSVATRGEAHMCFYGHLICMLECELRTQ